MRKRSTGQFKVGEGKVKIEYLINQYEPVYLETDSVVLLYFAQSMLDDVQLL